ncbi:MAG TPA: DNA-formamidopyrimidine glycosylase family protein [Bryobacteraceae bacterium]|nr:DNA-formamidopyrimidine glycosylase family protein [Bryobacteraceae bacterium]
MPEGDTIFRTAATLHRALAGSIVTGFETQLPALARIEVIGRTIEFARAAGKWVQIGFSGDLILLTHMLMSGSWHTYRPGEQWQKSRYHMRIVISTQSIVAVAFDVQVAEFHNAQTLSRRTRLGPDVLAANFEEAEAVKSLESNPAEEIGIALLKQSIIAGIGNVFKSEICFLAEINPFDPIGALSRIQIESLVATAKRSMTRPRTDWVYHHAGDACRKCGTPILSRKQGEEARTTFWCPTCQPRIKLD